MDTWAGELELDMDLYSDLVKAEAVADSSPSSNELPGEVPPLNWDKEEYSWEGFEADLFADVLPVSVENCDDQNTDSDIPSPGDILSEAASLVLPNRYPELMLKYGLTDDQLADITLKQLKRRCPDNEDYAVLKSYRRTCLNRGYARSSRSKQHEKTYSLSAKLRAAEDKINLQKKELDEKNMRIQYLELENRLLLDFNRVDN